MAEAVEVPSNKQALKDFFEIGNWTMPTYSVFLVACISSFFLVRFHMDHHRRFSLPFVLVLMIIVFVFSLGHYRLMTLNLHKNALILIGTFLLLGGVFFGLARLNHIL